MKLLDFFDTITKRVISVCGGGGKSSYLYRFASEWKDYSEHTLLATSTTKTIVTGRENIFDKFIVDASSYALCHYPSLYPEHKTFFVMSESVSKQNENEDASKQTNKLLGFKSDIIAKVSKHYHSVICEADGARMRAIKAPASYEPCHPINASDVVGVIGLSVYKQSICNENVHRCDIFNKLTATQDGQIINEEVIARLVNSPDGLFKDAPPLSKRYLLFNQADLLSVQECSRLLEYFSQNCKKVDCILFCSLKSDDPILMLKSRN